MVLQSYACTIFFFFAKKFYIIFFPERQSGQSNLFFICGRQKCKRSIETHLRKYRFNHIIPDNMLYFVDGGTHKIESMDLLGGNRREIFQDPGAHFFAIDAYDKYLYYTDWNHK